MNDSMRVQMVGVPSELVAYIQDRCRSGEQIPCEFKLDGLLVLSQLVLIVGSEFSYTPDRFDISFEMRPVRS